MDVYFLLYFYQQYMKMLKLNNNLFSRQARQTKIEDYQSTKVKNNCVHMLADRT